MQRDSFLTKSCPTSFFLLHSDLTFLGGLFWPICVDGLFWAICVDGLFWTISVGCFPWSISVGGSVWPISMAILTSANSSIRLSLMY
jgi:hypothetical protein